MKDKMMTKMINQTFFEVGDIVICRETTNFVDNTVHLEGEYYLVTRATVDYYNVNWERYEKEN